MKTVILCGGSGKRLWPISRESSPKQFLKLFKGKSLFEMTISRNRNISESFSFVVKDKLFARCREQVPDELLGRSEFLLEPCSRNTAAAITLAAMASTPEEVLLILPSDHLIHDLDKYENSINKGRELAQSGGIVTFGIKPNYPGTQFGYIELEGLKVKSFKEKPNSKTAMKYFASADYLWNSGIFCFKAGVFLEELENYCPDIFNQCVNTFEGKLFKQIIGLEKKYFFSKEKMNKIPSASIDYALMEKSKKLQMISADFQWSDLGSFRTLFKGWKRILTT